MAHWLDSQHLLTLCDEAFVLKCGAAEHPEVLCKPSPTTCLTAYNVAALYTLAADVHLPGGACCTGALQLLLPADAWLSSSDLMQGSRWSAWPSWRATCRTCPRSS